MKKQLFKFNFVSNSTIILGIVVLFALMAGIQMLLLGENLYSNGLYYTHYNNFIIFKQSFFHLIARKDLYQYYLTEQWDLYKYSPTFAFVFGIFSFLPNFLGLLLWDLLNGLILFAAIYYLPQLNLKQKGYIILLCIIELMTSMQNSQSNALMAGLIILSFGLLERKIYILATFCLVFSIYIKIFGIVGLAMFIFYPQKWKLIVYSAVWTLILFFLPLICIDFTQLKYLYFSWQQLLIHDTSSPNCCSIFKLLGPILGKEHGNTILFGLGAIILLIPYLRISQYKNYLFRLFSLSAILIWVVLFNHKAESPTFIIAMSGVAIWFITGSISPLNSILLIIAFILTSLSPTDIFPRYIRDTYVNDYALKALPCLFIWIKVICDLTFLKFKEYSQIQKIK